MRVALIGPANPYRGGIAQTTDSLAGELSRAHAVQVVSFRRQYPALFFPGTSEFVGVGQPPSLRTQRVIDTVNPRTWLEAARRVGAWQPDVVALMWWHPYFGLPLGVIARLISAQCPTRVGFVCHNVRPHEPAPGAALLCRYALSAGRFHVVMSSTVARELTQLLPQARPVQTLLPPYDFTAVYGQPARDEARRRLGLGASDRVALMFGLIRRYKGLDVLLRALAAVPDLKLIVAGEFYDPAARYHELIRAFGLTGRVSLLDRYVPDADVSTYLAAADVLVAPYTSASQSMVLPLGRAAGLPIIASDFDGLTQHIKPGVTGLAVAPGDAVALAEALRHLFERERLPAFQRAAQAAAPSAGWSEFARALLEAAQAGSTLNGRAEMARPLWGCV